MERLNAAIEAGEKAGLPDNDLVLKSARQMRDEEKHRSVAKQTLDAFLALDPLGQKNTGGAAGRDPFYKLNWEICLLIGGELQIGGGFNSGEDF